MERIAKLIPLFAWLSLPVAVLFYSMVLAPWLRRPAIEYTSARLEDHPMTGTPGEWSTVHFAWGQRREGCVLNMSSLSVVLVDARGLAYEIGSERGGVPLTFSERRGVVDFAFKVPEQVPSGQAHLVLSTAFRCGRWATDSASARYVFEVVPQ